MNEKKIKLMTFEQARQFLDSFAQRIWVFFDTETTGFSGAREQITQISAAAFRPHLQFSGKIDWHSDPYEIDSFDKKVFLTGETQKRIRNQRLDIRTHNAAHEKPDWSPYPGFGKGGMSYDNLLEMTDYYETDAPLNAPRPGIGNEHDVLRQFEQFLRKMGGPGRILLVAQNAPFDLRFVNNIFCRRFGRSFTGYQTADTLAFTRQLLIPTLKLLDDDGGTLDHLQRYENTGWMRELYGRGGAIQYPLVPHGPKIYGRHQYSHRLGDVAEALGMEPSGWHNSLYDVYMTVDVLFASMQLLAGIENEFPGLLNDVVKYRRRQYKRALLKNGRKKVFVRDIMTQIPKRGVNGDKLRRVKSVADRRKWRRQRARQK